MAPLSKLMNLSEAIRRYVPDGAEVVMGTSLETLIPFAAGHEIMRQRKKNLTLIGPISDILFDEVIGAGCVRKTRAAWVGNVITGSSYNFRRAAEGGTIETEDHSNLTISMALKAGAMGVPFMPALTALGSDLYKTNQSLKKITCPFTGVLLTAVSAINPDVAVIHVQRADEYGNAHLWGNLGVTREACLASRHVIITTEDIVSPDVIESDPNRIITPGFHVSAVVHAPWGAHPSPVPGYYNRDHEAFIEYRENSKTIQKFEEWMRCWIDNVKTGDDYLRLLGNRRVEKLKLINHFLSVPADYGY
jgi:glutaconate CoA-transferase, subunit A